MSLPLLMRTTLAYSQVVAACITLQTICSLMVSITGFPRVESDGIACQDVEELLYVISKNAMLVFMLNVSNYITVNRGACKVYLR